jgi:hypothetical protein
VIWGYHSGAAEAWGLLNSYIVSNGKIVPDVSRAPSAFVFLVKHSKNIYGRLTINPLTPELNPSAQSCLPRFFTGDFNF